MADRADLPGWAKPDLWLDDAHAVEFTYRDGQAEPIGAILWHRPRNPKPEPSATSGWCAGGFQWDGTLGPNWALHSLSPLHVEPSIQCGCGEHGFIRGGKWEPA